MISFDSLPRIERISRRLGRVGFDVIVGKEPIHCHALSIHSPAWRVDIEDTQTKEYHQNAFTVYLPTCSNNPDKEKCIALHKIPFFDDDRPEAKKRRKRWVDFINSKRADPWQLSKDTAVCSKHFTRESFIRKVFVPGTTPNL